MDPRHGVLGLIGLVDEAHEESLVITLWADEASAEASASAGDASASSAPRHRSHAASLRGYAVTIFDVPGRKASQVQAPVGTEAAPTPPLH